MFAFCRNEFRQAQALPAGHVPLARLLRLTPEDRPFPTPVQAGRGGPKIVNHTKVQGSAFPLSGMVRLRKLLKEQPNLVLLARRHVDSKLCSNYLLVLVEKDNAFVIIWYRNQCRLPCFAKNRLGLGTSRNTETSLDTFFLLLWGPGGGADLCWCRSLVEINDSWMGETGNRLFRGDPNNGGTGPLL